MEWLTKRKKRKIKTVVERLRLPKMVIRTVFGDQAEFSDVNDPEFARIITLLTERGITFTIYAEYCHYKEGRIRYDGSSYYNFKATEETLNTGEVL